MFISLFVDPRYIQFRESLKLIILYKIGYDHQSVDGKLSCTVAYLECAKEGGPGGPPVGSRGKAPVGGLGTKSPRR